MKKLTDEQKGNLIIATMIGLVAAWAVYVVYIAFFQPYNI